MLRTIFPLKIAKNGFVTHRCARFFAGFACYAQDFFPVRAGAPQQRCAGGTGVMRTVHVTHDFCNPETAKISKNGFVTHRCARFFTVFAFYAQDFFPTRGGLPRDSVALP